MKVKAEKIGEDIRLTITDNLNVTIQVTYKELRKEINKSLEKILYPKIK